MLLLLLSRFSHVRLCATPYTAAHQVLVNSKSKLHFTEETVKFRKVNDSPRDTLQAILSSEWNPVVLLQRRTQMPQGASLSAGPGRGSRPRLPIRTEDVLQAGPRGYSNSREQICRQEESDLGGNLRKQRKQAAGCEGN